MTITSDIFRAKAVLHTVAMMAIAVCITIMTGCSTKKNTAATRNYQAFITRYNVYFNGDEHYKETLKQLEDTYQDDYSRLIPVHPVHKFATPTENNTDASFARSVEKARKAIQLRSIKKRPRRQSGRSDDMEYQQWLKREEYNPFLHNAWMLLGKSQFMDGDFTTAASTFNYIVRHFSWLPETVTEARLWLAWSYILSSRLFEAESALRSVNDKKLTTPHLRELNALVRADLYISDDATGLAIPFVRQAAGSASGSQKIRLRFLLAQLLALNGQNSEAYEIFASIARSQSADYRTKFNARIKQSEVVSGQNNLKEIKSLRSMLRYERNKEYADQIFYAIGNLYVARKDTAAAIKAYRQAVANSSRQGIEKALAQLRLGQLYFEQRNYDLAQPEYAEAVPLLPETYPDYKNIRRRSDVLDRLAVYSHNVMLQDSLLKLSELTPDQQMSIVNKIIDNLKKRDKQEADQQRLNDFMAGKSTEAAISSLQTSAASVSSFTINNDNSWYFYNDAAKNAGRTEFQKRWGNRKLEDDWRRHNKATFTFNDFEENSEDDDSDIKPSSAPNTEDTGNTDSIAATMDPHNPRYYLSQIPKTDAQRANANSIIQQGLYNMGIILKDNLEDFPASLHQFSTLLSRYPDNIYRLDTYYNLFLMYMRMGNRSKAEEYRRLIIDDFADSKIGYAMRDPQYLDNLISMNQVQDSIYDMTYRIYLEGSNPDSIHSIVRTFKDKYSVSPIMPKFLFLDALAYVNQNNSEDFGSTLRMILEQYPESDVSELASSWFRQLNQGRRLNQSSRPVRSMIWTTKLSANSDDSIQTNDNSPQFDLKDPGQPVVVLAYPVDSVNANLLLYEVARHNFSSFTIRDFDLEQMNFGNLGLLTISGFKSERDVRTYLDTLARIDLPEQIRTIVIGKKNFNLMITSGASFDDYFKAIEQYRLKETHESNLPADIYPSAEEMYGPGAQSHAD